MFGKIYNVLYLLILVGVIMVKKQILGMILLVLISINANCMHQKLVNISSLGAACFAGYGAYKMDQSVVKTGIVAGVLVGGLIINRRLITSMNQVSQAMVHVNDSAIMRIAKYGFPKFPMSFNACANIFSNLQNSELRRNELIESHKALKEVIAQSPRFGQLYTDFWTIAFGRGAFVLDAEAMKLLKEVAEKESALSNLLRSNY